jgi:hypothetical protein
MHASNAANATAPRISGTAHMQANVGVDRRTTRSA